MFIAIAQITTSRSETMQHETCSAEIHHSNLENEERNSMKIKYIPSTDTKQHTITLQEKLFPFNGNSYMDKSMMENQIAWDKAVEMISQGIDRMNEAAYEWHDEAIREVNLYFEKLEEKEKSNKRQLQLKEGMKLKLSITFLIVIVFILREEIWSYITANYGLKFTII